MQPGHVRLLICFIIDYQTLPIVSVALVPNCHWLAGWKVYYTLRDIQCFLWLWLTSTCIMPVRNMQ